MHELTRVIHRIYTTSKDRVFERFFFADSQVQYMKVKRQKPRREERPRMSKNTLSSGSIRKVYE